LILELKKLLIEKKIDGFIIPSNDEFQGEYIPEDANRLKFVTNFTGSNGIAIITKDKCAFFTDGRYTLQAQKQLDTNNFEIYDLAELLPWKWLENNEVKSIGFDPWLHTEENIKKYLNPVSSDNIVDMLWKRDIENIKSDISLHPLYYAGQSYEDKINSVLANLKSDYVLITEPDIVCWLLNIRGRDVPYCPLVLCYVFVDKKGVVTLFHKYKMTKTPILKNVKFFEMDKLEKFCHEIRETTIQLDPAKTPYWFMGKFKHVERKICSLTLDKACKNIVEARGAAKAHIFDGLAVIKFLHFLETNENISEIEAAEHILRFRQENKLFKMPSFSTIAGYGANGAIIHYSATPETNQIIGKNNLLLLDSGGQYPLGTTDITRTIHLGRPSKEHIKYYSLVLKGHVNLAKAIFPIGTTGAQLDILARMPLWEQKEDFNHGTGHGVGSYLSVHEGPQRIGKLSTIALMEGMIVSNEPGYYKEGKFGIRIENLLIVERDRDGFLKFRTLTLVPYERKLIDTKILTREEIAWINSYHKFIMKTYEKKISDKNLLQWLKGKCREIG